MDAYSSRYSDEPTMSPTWSTRTTGQYFTANRSRCMGVNGRSAASPSQTA
jgi:hypothetical protein